MALSLEASYGKQNVPVFKVTRSTAKHEVVDMIVNITLTGDISKSWVTGDNSQILPTETQKNTCYAIAAQTEFTCVEHYGLALGRDILKRHRHLAEADVRITERVWDRIPHSSGAAHNHGFMRSRSPVQRGCRIRVTRDPGTTVVTSSVSNLVLMKTAQSGFKGFIKDKYTNLEPVGSGTGGAAERILCTELEASWTYAPGRIGGDGSGFDFAAANAAALQALIDNWAGPPDTGRYSLSLQITTHRMCTAVLDGNAAIDECAIVAPNVHFYLYDLGQFGVSNPNTVFQSTDPATTASGRIVTRVRRGEGARARL